MTRVSVIVPVFNGERTLAATLKSALAQQFDGFEVVVVNDGSTDATADILKSFGATIRTIYQTNRGLAAARNAGAASSITNYLAFLDADDDWVPDKLAKTVSALDKNPASVLAYSDLIAIDDRGNEERLVAGDPRALKDMLTTGQPIIPSAVVMRRTVWQVCGGFNEGFRCSFEDAHMWLLARERGEFEYVAEPLVRYRTTAFAHRADKYESGRRLFIRLVDERYGRAGAPLIRHVNTDTAASLFQMALKQLDAGERRAAFRTLTRIARIRPSFLAQRALAQKLVRPRNLRRLVRLGARGTNLRPGRP